MRAPVFSSDTAKFLGSVSLDIFGVPLEDRRRLRLHLMSHVPHRPYRATSPIEAVIDYAEFEPLSVHRWNDQRGTKATGWVLFTDAAYADLYNRVPSFRPSED